MGRGPVAQVINHECKVVVEAGLEWAQKDGIPGLSAGREWTAAGEQHMKEVVRKLVTATEWEDLQETYYNLQGLSAQSSRRARDTREWQRAVPFPPKRQSTTRGCFCTSCFQQSGVRRRWRS